MRFNKSIKTQMVQAVITDKYEKKYEEAVNKVNAAARKILIKNSKHDSIVGKLDAEELKYVQATTSMSFNSGIRLDGVPFANQSSKRAAYFEPVYAADFMYLEDTCKPLADLRTLVSEIVEQLRELSSVVHSYTKVKDLFDALPWIKQYYPEQIETTGTLVDKTLIDELNAKFG